MTWAIAFLVGYIVISECVFAVIQAKPYDYDDDERGWM